MCFQAADGYSRSDLFGSLLFKKALGLDESTLAYKIVTTLFAGLEKQR